MHVRNYEKSTFSHRNLVNVHTFQAHKKVLKCQYFGYTTL